MGFDRWETAVSDVKSLAMVSLVDQDGLHVTVQDLRDPGRRRIRFTFRKVAAYRNVLEEFRTHEREVIPSYVGRTLVSAASAWAPEKVMFGTDAFSDPSTPLANWEEKEWVASRAAREALAIALTGMIEDDELSRDHALLIARMVLRENAERLFGLKDHK